jgi:hypothetical protein
MLRADEDSPVDSPADCRLRLLWWRPQLWGVKLKEQLRLLPLHIVLDRNHQIHVDCREETYYHNLPYTSTHKYSSIQLRIFKYVSSWILSHLHCGPDTCCFSTCANCSRASASARSARSLCTTSLSTNKNSAPCNRCSALSLRERNLPLGGGIGRLSQLWIWRALEAERGWP